MNDLSVLVGLIPTEILQTKETIEMTFDNGSSCIFYHKQDCCEYVSVEEVAGDWDNLIGFPLLVAEERSEHGSGEGTYTFYTFRSIGGTVDVRWLGTSNGYYSEAVDFEFRLRN